MNKTVEQHTNYMNQSEISVKTQHQQVRGRENKENTSQIFKSSFRSPNHAVTYRNVIYRHWPTELTVLNK